MGEVKDVITRMNEMYSGMSKGRKAIAGYIFDHVDDAVFMTAAELGVKAKTSESTVVRFAMYLGYEGYPEFQEALEEVVSAKFSKVDQTSERYKDSTDSEILASVMNADIANIQDTMQKMDYAAFQMAVDIILNARTLYVVGLRSCGPLADFLHFYLNMVRGNIVLVKTTSVSEMFEQMIRIDENDAIIGISFPRYSMRTLKCMEFANDRNAKVISITDSIHSPMNLYSSCNLLAQSKMTSIVDSLTAPLSLINALVVALCMRRPEEVKRDLQMLEDTWSNYQVYLSDEIDFASDGPILNYPLKKDNER
ncbi:MAG: MurR/RpiR family transcriptional regulator [Butyrivibrio sp.]|nr:MurR/RpiR family transcriptional regulator [Butyrivibrio sp.]